MPNNDEIDEDKREDELTRAPKSDENDAAPRVSVLKESHVRRVEVLDSAKVRPGKSE
jgi:hypothetical protein